MSGRVKSAVLDLSGGTPGLKTAGGASRAGTVHAAMQVLAREQGLSMQDAQTLLHQAVSGANEWVRNGYTPDQAIECLALEMALIAGMAQVEHRRLAAKVQQALPMYFDVANRLLASQGESIAERLLTEGTLVDVH